MPEISSSNGHVTDEVVDPLQRRIDRARAHIERREADLAADRAQLKRDEKALALLLGSVDAPGGPRPNPARKPSTGAKQRSIAERMSEEALAPFRDAVLRYAADHEEFRQVDLRNMPGTPSVKSGPWTLAFERLRQDNVIRFARQDGNAKVFRLTREAVNAR